MSERRLRFPVGISDFRMMREGDLAYIDKTPFIDAVLLEGAQVLLIPRPRRFGKTLNLSMLRYFFEKSAEDRSALFAGLAISRSEAARPHFQRYPVIFLTFKDIKPGSWDDCLAGLANVLSEVYGEHDYLLEGGKLDPADEALFTAIRRRRATRTELLFGLRLLSRVLAAHHGEKVVLLLDEYDSPIHAGYTNHYYDEIIGFFRDFLSGGLKDNPHIFKGVLTGILRVAKESLFSGLNNVDVFSILRTELGPYFGFTEPEVKSLVEAAGEPALLDEMRAFYNGYLFGGQAIYNPWSVLCFLSRTPRMLLPHWIDTSNNDLVRELLLTGPEGVREELEALLQGGALDQPIDENIVLRDASLRSDTLWSFLLFTGYLKPISISLIDGQLWAKLAVPNAEVAIALRGMARSWLASQVGGDTQLRSLLAALLAGEAALVEKHLSHMLGTMASSFDTQGPEPERFYHGLVIGLLAGLGSGYEVRSNRESGSGRCDVMILPKAAGQPGVALELKRVGPGESKARAMAAGMRQIRAKDYATELRERGASPIHEMVAVFEGKLVSVRSAGEVLKGRRKVKAKSAPGKKGARKG
ncbi:MAG: AAA family ATPase [Byssovorax sp.]